MTTVCIQNHATTHRLQSRQERQSPAASSSRSWRRSPHRRRFAAARRICRATTTPTVRRAQQTYITSRSMNKYPTIIIIRAPECIGNNRQDLGVPWNINSCAQRCRSEYTEDMLLPAVSKHPIAAARQSNLCGGGDAVRPRTHCRGSYG